MFANLLRESKRVEISGVAFGLKKWPQRLKNWLTIRMLEGAPLSEDKKTYTNIKPMARPFEEVEEECLEKVFLGVESWGLRGFDDKPIPVNRQAVHDLYTGFPGVFSALLLEIENFNSGIPEEAGEASPSTSTT